MLDGVRDRVRVIQLALGGEGLLEGRDRGGQVALLRRQAAEGGERVGAELGHFAIGPSQCARQPAPTLRQEATDLPVTTQVGGQPELGGRSAGIVVCPLERGTDVFAFRGKTTERGIGARRGAREQLGRQALDELDDERLVPAADISLLVFRHQQLDGVLLDAVQQPIAGLLLGRLDHDQGAVDEAGQ